MPSPCHLKPALRHLPHTTQRLPSPSPAPLQVHSGADLQASASAAAQYVPSGAKGYLGYVLSHSNGPEILPIMEVGGAP